MAKAAKCVVAEVEEVVEDGEIDPDQVHVPGVYVHKIFKSEVDCSPCFVRECPLEKQICLFDVITSEGVAEYINSQMTQTKSS